MKDATLRAAVSSRRPSRPPVIRGRMSAAASAISTSTTSISMSVTPAFPAPDSRFPVLFLFRFPTDDVRIVPFAAGRTVGAKADDVGVQPVVAWELVDIGVSPGVRRDILGHVGPFPAVHAFRLFTQRLQSLLGSR